MPCEYGRDGTDERSDRGRRTGCARTRSTAAGKALSGLVHQREKAIVLGRLVEELIRTRHRALSLVFRKGIVRKDKDARARHVRKSAHLPYDIDPGAFLELDIGDDNVR